MATISTLQHARRNNSQQERLRANAQSILVAAFPEEEYFRSFLNCGSSRDMFYRHNDKFTISVSDEGFAHLLEATCNSSFLCPCCSHRVMRNKASELTEMITTAQSLGYHVYLVTHTIPHSRESKLKDLMDSLSTCLTCTYDSRAFRDLKREYGYVGFIRCFDITLHLEARGNGWHPHLHNVLIFEDYIDPVEIRKTMFPEYRDQVERLVGSKPSARAFDVTYVAADDGVAEYISKLHLTQYITKNSKQGDTLYPFDLLVSDDNGEFPFADYFVEYAIATRGIAKIRTSRGLKAKLLKPDVVSGKNNNKTFDVPRSVLRHVSLEHDFLEAFVVWVEEMDTDHLNQAFRRIRESCESIFEEMELDKFRDSLYMNFIDRLVYEGEKMDGEKIPYWGDNDKELAVEFIDLGNPDFLFEGFGSTIHVD